MATIQHKIDRLIESKKLTKSAFAKAVGIHLDTVYNLKDETIKLSTLLKISEVLGVEIDYFLNNEDKTEQKNKLSIVAEESEVYGVVNYKEKYFETLEKLNACNERVLSYTDIKKGTIKKR